MSQKTKITKVIDQLKKQSEEEKQQFGESISDLSSDMIKIGKFTHQFLADIYNTMNDVLEATLLSISDQSANMKELIGSIGSIGKISSESAGVRGEEKEREDKAQKDKEMGLLETIIDSIKNIEFIKTIKEKGIIGWLAGFLPFLPAMGAFIAKWGSALLVSVKGLLPAVTGLMMNIQKILLRRKRKFLVWWKKSNFVNAMRAIFQKFNLRIRKRWLKFLVWWKKSNFVNAIRAIFQKFNAAIRRRWLKFLVWWKKSNFVNAIRAGFTRIGQFFGKGSAFAKMVGGLGKLLAGIGRFASILMIGTKGTSAVAGVLSKIFGAGGFFSKLFSVAKPVLKIGTKMSKFLRAIPVIGQIITVVGSLISGIWNMVKSFLSGEGIVKSIGAFFGGILNFLTFGLIKVEWVKSAFQWTFDMIIKVFKWIWEGVKFIWKTVKAFWKYTIKGIVWIFGKLWEGVKLWWKTVKAIWTPIIKGIVWIFGKLWEGVKLWWGMVTTIWSPIIKGIVWIFKKWWAGVMLIKDQIVKIFTNVKNIFMGIVTYVAGLPSMIHEYISTKMAEFMGILAAIVSAPIDFIKEVGNKISSAFGVLVEFFTALPKAFVAALKALPPGGKSPVDAFMEALSGGVGDEDKTSSSEAGRGAARNADSRRPAAAAGFEMDDARAPVEPTNEISTNSSLGRIMSAIKRRQAERAAAEAAKIDTREIEAQKRQAAAPSVVNNNVTNVQGGSGGGGGGAIIAPSATRMNESSFRTQTQNGMVPAMEG